MSPKAELSFADFVLSNFLQKALYRIYFINAFLLLQLINKENKSLISEVLLSDMILLPALTLLDYLENGSH